MASMSKKHNTKQTKCRAWENVVNTSVPPIMWATSPVDLGLASLQKGGKWISITQFKVFCYSSRKGPRCVGMPSFLPLMGRTIFLVLGFSASIVSPLSLWTYQPTTICVPEFLARNMMRPGGERMMNTPSLSVPRVLMPSSRVLGNRAFCYSVRTWVKRYHPLDPNHSELEESGIE